MVTCDERRHRECNDKLLTFKRFTDNWVATSVSPTKFVVHAENGEIGAAEREAGLMQGSLHCLYAQYRSMARIASWLI